LQRRVDSICIRRRTALTLFNRQNRRYKDSAGGSGAGWCLSRATTLCLASCSLFVSAPIWSSVSRRDIVAFRRTSYTPALGKIKG
jgi:hypothetical protein